MVPWEGYASDETMGTFAPILLYWVYAGGYQLVLHRRPLQRYRLHTRAEEEEKNLVTLPAVVRGVLLQQLVQAIVAMILFMVRRLRRPTVNSHVYISAPISDFSVCYFSAMLPRNFLTFLYVRYCYY